MAGTIKARAKINLTLEVLGKRPDGYHEVAMVMQSIGLHDCLELTPVSGGITILVEGADLSAGEDNLVHRAASCIRTHCGVRTGIRIRLRKGIPVAAGLGGGSADAAATLAGLNKIWGLGLTQRELMLLGEQLGSDVPFCLMEGTALALGRGEKLVPLPPCPPLGLVLVKPSFGVSTAEVYRACSPGKQENKPDSGDMVEAIKKGSPGSIAECLYNALEPVTSALHPEIMVIKEKLLKAGALGALMSGSGPTVFGLTADLQGARAVAQRYQKLPGQQVLITRTWNLS
ncbi:MAG: 4-diphosphocytidyl-2-C-methyl-D-erythritol kinase [Firmicutes bacterium ADurb.Bin456]|nr:MAG: 4-diphosphocytidyl-2-C-methyl-D-erythritol kinase [Firmicutes bacterium ADurb.Bin456]